MKKTIRFFGVFLCVAMLFSFAACKETETRTTVTQEKPFVPTSADSLWQKIDETMEAMKSYEISNQLSLTYYASGYEFVLEGEDKVAQSQKDQGAFYYTASDLKVSCEGLSMSEEFHNSTICYDGKIYYSNRQGEETQKLCAPMTYDEFMAEREENNDDLNSDDLLECTQKAFEKKEDGTWELAFSGYTKKAISSIMDSFGIPVEDYFGSEVEDMNLSVTANEDFTVKTLKISFLFEEKEASVHPKLDLTAEYSCYDQAEFDPAWLKAEEYTPVDSVTILSDVEEALSKMKESTLCEFTIDAKTTVSFGGDKDVQERKSDVSFGRKNGALHFDVSVLQGKEKALIQYQNGTLNANVGGETQSGAASEEEAMEMIADFLNPCYYNSLYVKGVEKLGEGVYRFQCSKVEEAAYALLVSEELKLLSSEHEIEVTMENDKISKMQSAMTLVFSYGKDTVTVLSETDLIVEKNEVQKETA